MQENRCKLLFFLLFLTPEISAKNFDRCELGRLLVNQYGIPRNQIADWLCLVQSESGYRTNAINRNRNGSTDYGLFQINNGFWCGEGRPGKDCNVACSDLLTDNITKAINSFSDVKTLMLASAAVIICPATFRDVEFENLEAAIFNLKSLLGKLN